MIVWFSVLQWITQLINLDLIAHSVTFLRMSIIVVSITGTTPQSSFWIVVRGTVKICFPFVHEREHAECIWNNKNGWIWNTQILSRLLCIVCREIWTPLKFTSYPSPFFTENLFRRKLALCTTYQNEYKVYTVLNVYFLLVNLSITHGMLIDWSSLLTSGRYG